MRSEGTVCYEMFFSLQSIKIVKIVKLVKLVKSTYFQQLFKETLLYFHLAWI